jgi:hypothetical protein
MTYIEYLKTLEGKKALDNDGRASVQCVDIAIRILKEFYKIESVPNLGDGKYVAENISKKFPGLFKYFPYSENLQINPGDIISYESSSSPNCGHVAVAITGGNPYSILEQWNTSVTIRKNTKQIQKGVYGKSYTIIGVSRPIKEIDTPVENFTNPEKTIEEIACEVIRGEWENGEKRKDLLRKAGYDPEAIQAKVNDILNEKNNDDNGIYKVRVNCSALNVRSGAGTDHDKARSPIFRDTICTIIEEKNGEGSEKWGKLPNGWWIALDFTQRL